MAFRWSVFVLVMVAGRASEAHTPHAPAGTEAAQASLAIAIEPEFGAYQDHHHEGSFQGMRLRVSGGAGRFTAMADVPAYRLQADGATSFGPGDPHLEVALRTFGQEGLGRAAGVALAASLPVGDAGKSLGMGHAMMMGVIWASVTRERLGVAAQVGYGRALASLDGHSGHLGANTGPVVNPMNQSEMNAGVTATLQVMGPLRLTAGVTGSLPTFAEGFARTVGSVGAEAALPSWNVGARVEATAVGSPSILRLILGSRFAFR